MGAFCCPRLNLVPVTSLIGFWRGVFKANTDSHHNGNADISKLLVSRETEVTLRWVDQSYQCALWNNIIHTSCVSADFSVVLNQCSLQTRVIIVLPLTEYKRQHKIKNRIICDKVINYLSCSVWTFCQKKRTTSKWQVKISGVVVF